MNLNPFLNCVGYFGISTGASDALEGVYTLNSGTTGIVYNQFYTTGAHFNNGVIVGSTLPLINVGSGILNNDKFSGVNCFRIGYQHTGNFGLLLDIESSGCEKRSQSLGRDAVLVSTVATQSGYTSGFSISINDANCLVFQTSGLSYVLNQPLKNHDFVYVGLGENRYVNFGVFDTNKQIVYSRTVTLETGRLQTNNLYIGGLLNNLDTGNYANFYGKIHQAILFNDAITAADIQTCVDCSFVTGFSRDTGRFTSSGIQITGVNFSGVNVVAFTGFSLVTGTVLRTDGSNVNVLLNSGVTGLVQTGEVAQPLFNVVAISGNRNVFNFQYDTNYLNSFSAFNLELDIPFGSGDVIEIYTYNSPNPNIDNPIKDTDWPISTGFVQLFGNGLAETSGVDFYVNRGLISGYTIEDILSYDVLKTGTLISRYSGYWSANRIALSGGNFFPPVAQYYENSGVPVQSGKVIVTGLSGICSGNPYYPSFGYDIYLNGQKLVSGIQYDISGSGTSGFVVALSGGLPAFLATPLYSNTGGLPTGVTDVHDSELTFMPQFSGFNRFLFLPTGASGIIPNLSGYSEQVWINGVRQVEQTDYVKFIPCEYVSGIYDVPSFDTFIYKSSFDTVPLWNFNFPPTPNGSATWSGFSGSGLMLSVFVLNCSVSLGSYPSGNLIEVWTSVNANPYLLSGYVPTNLTSGNFAIGNLDESSMSFKIRYRNENVIGKFFETNVAQATI